MVALVEDVRDKADRDEGRSIGYVITEPELTDSEYEVVLRLEVLALELARAESLDLGFRSSTGSDWLTTLAGFALLSAAADDLGEACCALAFRANSDNEDFVPDGTVGGATEAVEAAGAGITADKCVGVREPLGEAVGGGSYNASL